jgi:hypothetical protein
MDTETHVGAVPQLPDLSLLSQTGLRLEVAFSTTWVLILLVGAGSGWLSLAQVPRYLAND